MISERNINLEFQVFVWRIGKRSQSLSNILSIVPAWDSSKSSSLFSIISMVSLGYTPQLDRQKQTNKQPFWSCAKRCEQSLKVFQNRLRLYQGFILHSWSFKKNWNPSPKKRKRDLLFQPSFLGCYVITFDGFKPFPTSGCGAWYCGASTGPSGLEPQTKQRAEKHQIFLEVKDKSDKNNILVALKLHFLICFICNVFLLGTNIVAWCDSELF